ncbi:MAG TPA: FAD-dependent oxidoreductase [Vicinamibacteria bacterium]|nr:FAD-dependent oxidoreductase [Vicinamibacteria bacterium]
MNFTLVDPPETDGEENLRSFSIASAPGEEDLMVATRMRDTAFKRVLKAVALGTEVKLDGPFGSFTLHRDGSRPPVFVAGGIGITPFRSMILGAARNKPSPSSLSVLFQPPSRGRGPSSRNFKKSRNETRAFQCIGTFTELEKSLLPWQGKPGVIDQEMLSRHLGDLAAPIYYSAGPPAIVAALRQMLLHAGVNEDDVRTEDFAVY